MRILLDQDQVLCKWTERILEWYNADYGTNITRDDIKTWNITDYLGPQGRDFMRSCMRWPEFYTRLEPIPGAVEGVKQLMGMGHEIRIVTAVPSSAAIAYHGKQQWVRDHMPFFDLENFCAYKHKEEVEGDMLVDDGGHNIVANMKKGRKHVVVFDCPWNQEFQGTHRVRDWKHLLELVRHIDAGDRIAAEYHKKISGK